jgi:hypothetical protein
MRVVMAFENIRGACEQVLAGTCEVEMGCGRYVVDYVMNEFSRNIGEEAGTIGIYGMDIAQVRWVRRQRGGESSFLQSLHVVAWAIPDR